MGASSDPNQDGSDEQQRRSEIYTYEAPWHIYAMNWSVRKDKKYRLAIASLLEQYQNRVEIVQLDDSTGEIRSDQALSFDHPYPPTKLMFIPDKECQRPDLLASSSDYLRLWKITDSDSGRGVELKSLLKNNWNSEFSGPLTSFDWNEAEPRRIGTSSIDTTCTIWDIEKEVVDTQLIAHDKEVYDIAWGGVEVFASVSADGSVRVFDLRDKEHSTIIYGSSKPDTPLVRLGWNKQDLRYMATIIMDSSKVVVLDTRFPTLPVVELQRHQARVNAIAWAPHSACHICTAGDDSQALIWDLSLMGQSVEGGLDPIRAYTAGAEIEQLQWSSSQPDWVAIAFSNKIQILRNGMSNFKAVRDSDDADVTFVSSSYMSSSGADYSPNPTVTASNWFDKSIFRMSNVTNANPPNRSFVKVYMSGSFGRSLDITKFSSYAELRTELAQMFGLEGQLEDPLRSGWQLVFVNRENDVLILGDDPWQEFVNSVWYVKILSPQEVQEMSKLNF